MQDKQTQEDGTGPGSWCHARGVPHDGWRSRPAFLQHELVPSARQAAVLRQIRRPRLMPVELRLIHIGSQEDRQGQRFAAASPFSRDPWFRALKADYACFKLAGARKGCGWLAQRKRRRRRAKADEMKNGQAGALTVKRPTGVLVFLAVADAELIGQQLA